jgi:hypothetical protein
MECFITSPSPEGEEGGRNMSCIDCEEKPLRGAYYRWKNANVEIIACEKHCKEIMEALNKVQKENEENLL